MSSTDDLPLHAAKKDEGGNDEEASNSNSNNNGLNTSTTVNTPWTTFWQELTTNHNSDDNDPAISQALTSLHQWEDSSLRCQLCRNLYTCPIVSVRCPSSHSFCNDCWSQEWSHQYAAAGSALTSVHCPLCNHPLPQTDHHHHHPQELLAQRNPALEHVVEGYKTMKPLLQHALKGLLLTRQGSSKQDESNATAPSLPAVGATAAAASAPPTAAAPPPLRVSWDDQYQQLVHFHRLTGHTRVRYQGQDDPQLKKFADWVRNQRYLLAKRQQEEGESMAPMYQERIAKLNALDFDWAAAPPPQDESKASAPTPPQQLDLNSASDARARKGSKFHDKWDAMYAQLVLYYEQHGHTNLTVHDKTCDAATKLHDWVRNQKYLLGRKMKDAEGGRLSPVSAERIDRLEALNFVWRNRGYGSKGGDKPNNKKATPRHPVAAAAAVGSNAVLANTLGKVLGALDHLTQQQQQPPSSDAGRKRPAMTSSVWDKKRDKMERKLDMVNQQLADAADNAKRFDSIQDTSLADQAKTRMVELHTKKVDLETRLLALVDEEAAATASAISTESPPAKRGKRRATLPHKKPPTPAERQRAQWEQKLHLVTQHLADAEVNVERLALLDSDTLATQTKARMATLYHQKVELENQLMTDMEEDEV